MGVVAVLLLTLFAALAPAQDESGAVQGAQRTSEMLARMRTIAREASGLRTVEELEACIDDIERATELAPLDAELARYQLSAARETLHRLFFLHMSQPLFTTPRGRELFDRIERATAPVGNHDRSDLDLNLACVRFLFGETERALAELEALFDVPRVRTNVLLEYLGICGADRNLAAAWPVFERFEREIAEGRGSNYQRAKYYGIRTVLLQLAGLSDAAADSLARALATPLDPCVPLEDMTATNLRLTQCDQFIFTARYAEALRLARELMPTVQGQLRARANMCAALAQIRMGDGDERAALESFEQVAVSGTVFADRARAELALNAIVHADYARARGWLEVCAGALKSSSHEAVLSANAFLAVADLREGREPLVPLEVLERLLLQRFEHLLAQWDSAPPSASGAAFLQVGYRRDLFAALCSVVLARTEGESGVERCLDLLLAAEARGSTARNLGLAPQRFAQVRERLIPPGGGLLVFVPGTTGSLVFVATRERLSATARPREVSVQRAASELRAILAQPARADWEQALRAAAAPAIEWCFPESVREQVRECQELHIVGRDMLAGLSFECLPWDDAGVRLGEAKALCDLPSMTLVAHYAARAAPPREYDLALLSAGALDAAEARAWGVEPLPLESRELSRVISAVDAGRAVALPRATSADLLDGAGASARLALIFAHGVVDPQLDRPYGLLLRPGRDGASGAVFADALRSASEVVWLGSCGSYGGGARRGEDGGHRIANAFLQSGANVVITSEGDLDLDATLFAARVTVEQLVAGRTVAQALRAAREEVARQPQWRHPYYSAQLMAVGVGEQRVALSPARSRVAWWWIAGVGTLALAALFVVRRARSRVTRSALGTA